MNPQPTVSANVSLEEEVKVHNGKELEPQSTEVASDSMSVTEECPLDEEVETVLGVDPSAEDKKAVDLHQSLVAKWNTWLTEGLSKENREILLDKYPRKGNVHLEAPELNEEVVATLNESGIKRDRLFISEQNLVGSAMSAVGESISMILKDDEEPVDRLVLLERLVDAGKLMSQLHFQISSARRSFIAPVLSKQVKEMLHKTKPGAWLYGEKLSEKIKAAKSMEKIGKEMKSVPIPFPSSSKKQTKPTPGTSGLRYLNWRSPYASQEQPHLG